jgi:hypothetical protein
MFYQEVETATGTVFDYHNSFLIFVIDEGLDELVYICMLQRQKDVYFVNEALELLVFLVSFCHEKSLVFAFDKINA